MSFISAAQLRAEHAKSVPAEPAVVPEHSVEGEDESPPLTLAPAYAGAGIADRGVVADAHASDEILTGDQGSAPPPTRCGGATSATPSEEEGALCDQARILQAHFTDTTATSSLGHHTIFTPQAQGAFLASLAHQGNVRLACRAASVSAQTAYRARRRSAGFARAWDAALVSARVVAEDALADRALNGWEEPVFYHGEEIARRRRYSDRLLLAHLARLDALAARADVEAGLAVLDDQIEALARGEVLPDTQPSGFAPQDERNSLRQDPVPSVPSCRVSPSSNPKKDDAVEQPKPCPDCGGACDDPNAKLGPEDCEWLGNRLERMNAARPKGELAPCRMPYDLDDINAMEALQLEAFEADGHEWWLVTNEAEMLASCTHGYEGEGESSD